MTTADALQLWYPTALGVLFFFALGGNVGSFINVLAYRMPLGKSVVRPPSACPACETRLRWNDNIPVFGWLMLRGRCRYCRTPISWTYPAVELSVALLFTLTYLVLFADPGLADVLRVPAGAVEADWTRGRWQTIWPAFALVLAMVGVLFAVSLIDAKTFLIPLEMLWGLAAVAMLTHAVHAGAHGPMLSAGGDSVGAGGWWTPTPTDALVYPSLAGLVGLAIACLLLRLRLLPRSYADYDQWEQQQQQARESAAAHTRDAAGTRTHTHTKPDPAKPPADEPHNPPVNAVFRGVVVAAPAMSGIVLAPRLIPSSPTLAMALGGLLGLGLGLVMRTLLVRAKRDQQRPHGAHADDAHPIDDWTMYPHARRESVKELLFLAVPAAAFAAVYLLAPSAGEGTPFWVRTLAGSALGVLVGGGVVWAVRVLASLAFGKEAMGLGDVHLMAAVGAVTGWFVPTLGFFVAPFFGIAVAVLGNLLPRRESGGPSHAIPYGPSLAAASVLVFLASPLVERAMAALLNRPFDLP